MIHKICTSFLLFVLGSVAFLLLLAGCASEGFFFEGYGSLLKGDEQPQIGILYFPYGKAIPQRLAQPIPDYSGWPRERMVKDLYRIKNLGVDFVVLTVDAADIRKDHIKSRYQSFFELVDDSQFPKLAFKITADHTLTLDERRYISNWIVRMCNSYPDAFFNFKRRCLVILPSSIRSWQQNHPALVFRFTAPSRRQWSWRVPRDDQAFTLGYQNNQAIVYAGWNSEKTEQNSWQLPRNKGRTLQKGLRKAVGRGVDIICVDSWNNFQNGSFIEPNTLDDRRVYQILQEEIRRMKKAGPDSNFE